MRCAGARTISAPPKRMLPLRLAIVPVSAASSVDLPAPFGPSSATVSPAPIPRFTPCSTVAAPYEARTSDSRSMAEVCVQHRRVRAHLVGRAFGDLGAEIEHHHAVRERQQKMHVVLDEEYRDAAPGDAANHGSDAFGFRPRQAGGGLVEEDELRRAGERARDLEQTPLAEREPVDRRVMQLREPDELDQALGVRALLAFLGERLV